MPRNGSEQMRFTAIDIETTGLSPEKERILEIGAVLFVDGIKKETFSTLVCPHVLQIPERITELTGITEDMVRNAPKEEQALKMLSEFLEGEEVLLGHNVLFDYSFLKVASERYGASFSYQGIDTLSLAKQFLSDLPSRSLSALCGHFGIETECAHRAYEDALAAAKLYFLLEEKYQTESERAFRPKPLYYEQKKTEPITPKQKNYLNALIQSRGLGLTPDISTMTKSEASRLIDRILSGQITG